ncbi:MAG TPA: hypothetical protein VNH40_12540 [Gaiellaceae bacterium]|nr:hypothetical protein [Gaiellaceae bacterium]
MKVALVVVAGVGDEASSPVASLMGALVAAEDSAYRPTEQVEEKAALVVGPVGARAAEWGPAQGTLEEVPAATLLRRRGAGGQDQVDLFEMPWSDISRFPKGLSGFVATLFGLAVQFGTFGMEAIAGLQRSPASPGQEEAPDRWKVTNWLMNASSWLAVALVVPITSVTTIAAVNLWLVVDAPGELPNWVPATIVAVLGAPATWFVANAIVLGGWRYAGTRWWHRLLDSRLWTLVAYGALLGVWFWRLREHHSVTLASADALLYAVGFALRPAWMLALAAVAVALLALAASGLWRWRQLLPGGNDEAKRFRRRWVTAVMTTIGSPLALALVGTLLFAGLGAVAFKSAESGRWGSDAAGVTCLRNPSSWETGTACGGYPGRWPTTATRIRDLNQRAKSLREEASRASGPGYAVDLRSKAADLTKKADELEAANGMTPVDWGRALFITVAIPVTDATIAVLTLIALAAIAFGAGLVAVRHQPGRLLARLLRALGSSLPSVIVLVFGLAGVALTWGVWLGLPGPLSYLSDDPWSSKRAGYFAGLGGLTSALLLVGRLLPIDPRGWGLSLGARQRGGTEVGGNLEWLRAHLDPAYDIATYLRIARDKSNTRPRIIARYRALLRQIANRGYDALLIVAHSQGSVLSAATLFGDPHRRNPEGEHAAGPGVLGWRELPEPLPKLPGMVALLTCGCPLRQSYDARLPGDYDWLWAETPGPGVLEPLSIAWINAYRPRDYIGQAVFHQPLTADTQRQHQVLRAPAVGNVSRLDVCLKGRGNHVGYWKDCEFAKWVDYAIRRCVDPSVAYPDLYAE